MANDVSVDNIKAEPMDLNDDDNKSSVPVIATDTAKEDIAKVANGDTTATDTTTPADVTVKVENGSPMKVENGSNGDSKADISLASSSGKVVQVTNVSPGATLQQLAQLFGFIGTVTDIRLYPSDEASPVQVKVCYIKYENNEQCGVAQHLTNTVFIDKALIVVPISREEIPEEGDCDHLIKSINAYATMSSTGYLPAGFPTHVEGETTKIPGLPPPPVITHSTDPVEVEEIKRTIFVTNIDPSVMSEQLMAFFSGVGEIKYIRLCKQGSGNKYAFIEFSGSESVPTALQYNGVIFGGQCLKVDHAKSPIVKPESERIASGRNQTRSNRDVAKRPSSANWDSVQKTEPKAVRRSRSRSKSRRRSRSRGRGSKDRDKAKRSSRSASKSKRKKSRSRSPRRKITRSPIRRRSRSRSKSKSRRQRSRSRTRSPKRSPPPPKRRSRSRSRDRTRRKRRSPTRSKSRSKSPRRSSKKKSKSKSRSPSRRKSRRSHSKSPDRSKRKKSDDKDKDKDKKKDKKDKESKDKKEDKEKDKDKDKSNPEGKDLKSLLDKVYNYEEEKEKEKKDKKSSKDKDKEKEKNKDKDKSSSDKGKDKDKEKDADVSLADKEIDWKDI